MLCLAEIIVFMSSSIQDRINQALEEARVTCSTSGDGSSECAVAWDTVEELQAEASHKRGKPEEARNSLQVYCDDNPDAPECRIYED